MNRTFGAGFFALIITSVLWGTTGTAASFAQEVSPLAIGAASLGLGGLLQGLIALPQLRKARLQLRARRALLACGMLSVAIYPLVFYSSMHLGGVALGTVISLGSAPMISGLLEWRVDGKRLAGRWWVAVALGILGSALLCLARTASPEGGSLWQVLASVFLGVLAGASYAMYSWAVGRLLATGISRSTAMGSVFSGGGLLLMPVLVATGAPLLDSSTNVAVALYLCLIPMFLGYILFGVALSRVRASTATTVTLLEPAVAACLAVWIVGEQLGPAGWAGIAMIGAALAVLVWAPRTTRSLSSNLAKFDANQ